MQCPVCAVDMFVLEFERVEVDFCHRCGGVWLDSGVALKIFARHPRL